MPVGRPAKLPGVGVGARQKVDEGRDQTASTGDCLGHGGQGRGACWVCPGGPGPPPIGVGSDRGAAGAGDLSPPHTMRVPELVGGTSVRDKIVHADQGPCVSDPADCGKTSGGGHSLGVRDCPGMPASEGSAAEEEGTRALGQVGCEMRSTTLGNGCWRETGSSWVSIDGGSVADQAGGCQGAPRWDAGRNSGSPRVPGGPGLPRGEDGTGPLEYRASTGGLRADCESLSITQDVLGCPGVRDCPGARTNWGNQRNLPQTEDWNGASHTTSVREPPPPPRDEAGDLRPVTVRMVGSVALRVPMQVMGIEVMAVVDTGAEVTVLGHHLVMQLEESQRPEINRAVRTLRVAKQDEVLSSQGLATVDLNIGGYTYPWRVYIAETGEDLLLGADFLDENDITVQVRRGLLQQADWVVQCEVERRPTPVARVLLHETWTVPGYHEGCLLVPWEPGVGSDQVTGVLEPAPSLPGGLLVARALVDCAQPMIPIRCMNFSSQAISLPRGCILGDVVLADSVIGQIPVSEDDPQPWFPAGPELGDLQHLSQIWQDMDEDSLRLISSAELPQGLGSSEDQPPSTESDDPVLAPGDGLDVPQHLQAMYQECCTRIESQEIKDRLRQFLVTHQDAFARDKNDFGNCTLVKHKIETGSAMPVRQPFRRTPRGFEGEEREYLRQQLEAGVLVPSKSPWASPVVLVRKSDGTVCWCGDFRKVNDLTRKDAYPLPRIDSCLECLGAASLFSVFDLQSGYWQLQMDERDQEKTAITTKYGLFEYTKLPFGLCSAPSTFQRCMEMIFRGVQWEILLIYLDDLIVFSGPDYDEHFQRLQSVMQKLIQAGLKLKPSKCQLLQQEVLFLGHVVGQAGIRPNPALIEKVRDWPVPRNIRQLQAFLGLCNYYRRFVYKFSDIASPLNQLTRKGETFQWGERANRAFEGLKRALISSPCLALPLDQGSFVLDTDASAFALGGVLSQVQDEQERVIGYGSRTLSKEETRYCVTRRELLAVVVFLRFYRHFLLGRHFLLKTDHGSLRWLFHIKEPEGQLARWLEYLSEFDFDIEHRAGVKHQNADALSRLPDAAGHECHQASAPGLPCGNCDYCQKRVLEWSDFDRHIDDVTPLAAHPKVHRVLTRQQLVSSQDGPPPPQELNVGDASQWCARHFPAELARLQREDPDLGPVMEWMDQGKPPSREEAASWSPFTRELWLSWDQLKRVEGVLYRCSPEGQAQTEHLQLLIPRVLRKEVLQFCHDSFFGAHLGTEKTVKRIQQRFHWAGLRQGVRHHIKSCLTCGRLRGAGARGRAPLRDYRVGYPLDRVAVDIKGPLPRTPRGNTVVLVVTDYFTRWVEAYPLPDQQAETVAQQLVMEFIARLGCPLELHSDQGRNFQSVLFAELNHLLGITRTRTSPYHPSGNGLVEKFNQTLGRMILSFIDLNKSDWDLYLPLLTAAYRSTVHPSTGFTPNFLMLGREVNLPVHLVFPTPRAEGATCTTDYVAKLQERLERCFDLARQNLRQAASRQQRRHDTRVVQHPFQVGSVVYRRNAMRTALEKPWNGPFLITRVLSGCLYQVEDKRKSWVVHHDNLTPCSAEGLPRWIRRKQQQIHARTHNSDTVE